jgi:hypothetical protein
MREWEKSSPRFVKETGCFSTRKACFESMTAGAFMASPLKIQTVRAL